MGEIKEFILFLSDNLDDGQIKALDIINECQSNGDSVEVDVKPSFQVGGPVYLFQITIRKPV